MKSIIIIFLLSLTSCTKSAEETLTAYGYPFGHTIEQADTLFENDIITECDYGETGNKEPCIIRNKKDHNLNGHISVVFDHKRKTITDVMFIVTLEKLTTQKDMDECYLTGEYIKEDMNERFGSPEDVNSQYLTSYKWIADGEIEYSLTYICIPDRTGLLVTNQRLM